MRHYRELRDSALEEGAVPLKVRELVAVGMAIARQC
jgi:alkylhydroperoxidase/carboxymuconolactone decarboxylase family protein YurZ